MALVKLANAAAVNAFWRQTLAATCIIVPERNLIRDKRIAVSREYLMKIQRPVDLTLTGIQRWIKEQKKRQLRDHHKFVEERHQNLGPDLATAHFVVAREGAVKFVDDEHWYQAEEDKTYNLPGTRVAGMLLEAVDASGTMMMYESFDNFISLESLRYLNLSRCPLIDDWCLDRFAWLFGDTLQVLDLSECPQITERGLAALYRLRALRRLYLHNMPNIQHAPLVAMMLEEVMPDCIIEGIDYTDSASLDAANEIKPKIVSHIQHLEHSIRNEEIKVKGPEGASDIK